MQDTLSVTGVSFALTSVGMGVGARIAEAIEAQSTTQQALADHLGISHSAVNQWIAKDAGPKRSRLQKVAEFLRIRLQWLLTGEGEMTDDVVIVGKVGAGAEMHSVDDHALGAGLDSIERPPGMFGRVVGVEVEGDSMWPVYRPGDVIVYRRETVTDFTTMVGKDCIVRTRDGRYFVKMLRRRTKPGRYTLGSWNGPDIEDVPLEWAAPVLWVKRA